MSADGPETSTAPSPHPDAPQPFRWRLAHRPDIRFGHAAGGVAGVLAAVAVVAFVIAWTDDDATLPGAALNLALIAVAIAAGELMRGPVRSAAAAALAVAVPQVPFFLIAGDGQNVGREDFRLILLLATAAYVLFYVATWTRGRAVFLGLALLLAASWVVFEVASEDVPFALGVASEVGTQGPGAAGVLPQPGSNTAESGIASLVIGSVLLGAGTALDRRGRVGAATPCLLVGTYHAVSAAVLLGIEVESVYAAGVFLAIAGVAVGMAGMIRARRGTSWLGAIVLGIGVTTFVAQGAADVADGGDATVEFGAFALLGALAILFIGVLVARTFGEPVDGGEPIPPATAPPPPAPDAGSPSSAASTSDAAPASTAPAVAWAPPPGDAGPPEGDEG